MQLRDGLGVMRQVQTGSDSQFQHLAMNVSEQLRAELAELLSLHHPIHESGENVISVESHGSSVGCLSLYRMVYALEKSW